MIKINSQDGHHQYDDNGNIITTWDSKKCAWIVEKEYNNSKIDWWGKDNDFPSGYTLEEYIKLYPNWDKNPDITVQWTILNREDYFKTFREYPIKENPSMSCIAHLLSGSERKHLYMEDKDFKFPYIFTKTWEYLDETEESSLRLGKYCNFHKFASNVRIMYNEKEIFNGKLE